MRKSVLVITALAVCLGLAGFFLYGKKGAVPEKKTTLITEENEEASRQQAETAEASSTEQAAFLSSIEKEIGKPFTERGLGNPAAPVRIDEYASLSCSHCADFHLNIYPEFKREFIDTGKIYFVYNDFPTNGPALEAAILSRCIPIERYFQFVGFLFEEQRNWAYKGDYSQILRQHAKVLGLSDEKADQCLADQDLRQALVDHMKVASEKHGINSTPSFVVNGKDVLRGALSIDDYRDAIAAHTPKGQQSQ